jgi:hypothetical protein
MTRTQILGMVGVVDFYRPRFCHGFFVSRQANQLLTLYVYFTLMLSFISGWVKCFLALSW